MELFLGSEVRLTATLSNRDRVQGEALSATVVLKKRVRFFRQSVPILYMDGCYVSATL